jgi:hypothetical protein
MPSTADVAPNPFNSTDQVENLSSSPSAGANYSGPILSINHNWANSTTLLRMFDTLCTDVDACARSIDDVREMLQQARGSTGWEAEWVQEVQELVKRCVSSRCAVRVQATLTVLVPPGIPAGTGSTSGRSSSGVLR